MELCERCNEYTFSKDCNCKPFNVRIPDWWGDDIEVQYASDESDAAEKAIEKNDNESDVINSSIAVFVNDIEFNVEGELVARYHAYQKSE